jgi:hypothetical protein
MVIDPQSLLELIARAYALYLAPQHPPQSSRNMVNLPYPGYFWLHPLPHVLRPFHWRKPLYPTSPYVLDLNNPILCISAQPILSTRPLPCSQLKTLMPLLHFFYVIYLRFPLILNHLGSYTIYSQPSPTVSTKFLNPLLLPPINPPLAHEPFKISSSGVLYLQSTYLTQLIKPQFVPWGAPNPVHQMPAENFYFEHNSMVSSPISDVKTLFESIFEGLSDPVFVSLFGSIPTLFYFAVYLIHWLQLPYAYICKLHVLNG